MFDQLQAEVRLLSGDANNNIHQNDGVIKDVSANGKLVLFSSGPPVTGATLGITRGGLYLRDLEAGTMTFVGVPVGGGGNNNPTDEVEASLSDDGRYFAWSSSTDLIYWRDHQAGVTRLVTPGADNDCRRPILSGDGRYVLFVSVARNLIADTTLLPPAGKASLYLYDSQTETTAIVSLSHDSKALTSGIGGTAAVIEYDFSSDGRYVFYSTDSANAHPDRNGLASQAFFWVYRRDLQTGQVDVVSKNAAGEVPGGNFTTPRADATGNRVLLAGSFIGVFDTKSMVAGYPGGFVSDLYLKDLNTAEVWWVTRTTNGTSPDGVFALQSIALSGDGKVAAFGSSGTKFVTEDTDSKQTGDSLDLFRVDIGSAGSVTNTLITKAVFGTNNVGYFTGAFLPGTGDYVAFCTAYLQGMLGVGPDSSIHRQSVGVGVFNFGNGGGGDGDYADWASGLPDGARGLADMPQGDGISNLQKFVYGMEPTSSDRTKLPQAGRAAGTALGLAGDNNIYLTVTIRIRRDLPAGFAHAVTTAATVEALGASSTAAVQVGPPIANGEVDVYVFRSTAPVNNGAQGFLAVELSGQ